MVHGEMTIIQFGATRNVPKVQSGRSWAKVGVSGLLSWIRQSKSAKLHGPIYPIRNPKKNNTVTTEDGAGKLIGLDLDGFLLVEMENGQRVRFDTDNNSFDLMQGLISRK